MDYRVLGKTGLRVSILGFGCGNVGGLMIRGEPRNRVHAVARAIEAGVNYFDTSPLYGDGQSERNLGQVLNELGADTELLIPYGGKRLLAHPIALPASPGALV